MTATLHEPAASRTDEIAPNERARPRVAYLVSQYPAINHTFVLREIRNVREAGVDVRVASIASCDRAPDLLTEVEREERRATFYVKALGVGGAIGPHARTLLSRPAAYVAGLVYALRLAGPDVRRVAAYVAYFAEAVVVGDWMRRERVEHVHTHFSSTVALVLRRVFPITWSVTIHGPAEFDDPRQFHLGAKVASSRFVSTISHYARSQVMLASRADAWEKIEVCPLGVDPSRFAPAPHREHPEPFEVICVGRLAAVKAQHVLVSAIDRLVREGRDVRLRLVGDGPDRAALERRVAALGLGDRVRFEGWLNEDGVLALYRRADAFALASFAEGVPVVLMEAMAMEIPCVATCITGVPELIRDGIDGLLVPPSDDEALARAIGALVDDAALRRRLGRAGRLRVLAKYDLAANARAFARVLRERTATTSVAR